MIVEMVYHSPLPGRYELGAENVYYLKKFYINGC